MKPFIRKYLNVSQFLQDTFQFQKSKDPKFSYEAWATNLGIKNKSYLRFVVLGRRPINSKLVASFIQNLNLSAEDAEYFIVLTQYSQSKNMAEKKIFGRSLLNLLKTELDQMEITDHLDFLSNPLLPKLQTLLSFTDVKKNLANLAKILDVKEEAIEAGLTKLQSMKLIDMDHKPLKPSFKVPDRLGNAGALGLEIFYDQILEEAKNATKKPPAERQFRSLFVAMSDAEFLDFQQRLREFLREQLVKHNFDEFNDRRLFQIHFNAFSISHKQELCPTIPENMDL